MKQGWRSAPHRDSQSSVGAAVPRCSDKAFSWAMTLPSTAVSVQCGTTQKWAPAGAWRLDETFQYRPAITSFPGIEKGKGQRKPIHRLLSFNGPHPQSQWANHLMPRPTEVTACHFSNLPQLFSLQAVEINLRLSSLDVKRKLVVYVRKYSVVLDFWLRVAKSQVILHDDVRQHHFQRIRRKEATRARRLAVAKNQIVLTDGNELRRVV